MQNERNSVDDANEDNASPAQPVTVCAGIRSTRR